MPNERRINIRVDPDTFDLWEAFATKEKLGWQSAGKALFAAWYAGDIKIVRGNKKATVVSGSEIEEVNTPIEVGLDGDEIQSLGRILNPQTAQQISFCKVFKELIHSEMGTTPKGTDSE